jgi:hypothetical protein
VGVRDEKGTSRIKRRKASSDRLHVGSDGRYVFGRQEGLPLLKRILDVHEKFQVNGVHKSGISDDNETPDMEADHRERR